jgi:hypothetical protein
MRGSLGIAAALLVILIPACGGPSPRTAAAGGSGPGSAGTSGTPAGGGAPDSGGVGNAAGGGPSSGSQVTSNKLDVLFVIDNSSSMAGKQQVLARSVPRLVSRLTNPRCVDAKGAVTVEQPSGPSAACASGSREFTPLGDIHFGVITTSIGSHGGDVCANDDSRHYDDQAQLLPSKRAGVPSFQDSGFLAFDASGSAGEPDASLLGTSLSAMITAAGEDGCGYEAPLEAMYRFLVDPEPPQSVQVVGGASVPMGINDTLLAQREAFLRPDSSLAIVLFSDENDCSIIDSKQAWFVASALRTGVSGANRMPRATSACDNDPNDPCCRSCAVSEAAPPAGCMPLANDSVCSVVSAGQSVATYDVANDSVNLRCFDEQRRFGFDVLQPIERYRDGLSDLKIPNRAGALVDSPLFAARAGTGPRSPSQVSVSVIVGVPWQDLATSESWNGGPLEYLDSARLESNGRWPMLIGDATKQGAGAAPSDPFMVESIAPRTGQNPLTMTPIAPATSTNPQQNPINGHEKNNSDGNWDLQLSCTFPLSMPIVCANGMNGCDCAPSKTGDLSAVTAENSALCQPPGGGPPGTMQYYAKAYPGTRELTFARQMGERAVPASICARTVTDESSPEYGYGPAFDGLLKRLAQTLK